MQWTKNTTVFCITGSLQRNLSGVTSPTSAGGSEGRTRPRNPPTQTRWILLWWFITGTYSWAKPDIYVIHLCFIHDLLEFVIVFFRMQTSESGFLQSAQTDLLPECFTVCPWKGFSAARSLNDGNHRWTQSRGTHPLLQRCVAPFENHSLSAPCPWMREQT